MKKIKKWIKDEYIETKILLRNIPCWLISLFVSSIIAMNLLANKSIDLKVDWLALDCGILVSWISFLSMDILVKRFGAKASTKVSIFAIIINLIISLLFLIASKIPGVWGEALASENTSSINSSLNNTFSGSWYVLLGSTIAFIASSITNNTLNVLVGKIFKKKQNSFVAYAARSYISTMLAQFVDNFIFSLIVSLNFFGWSILQCLTCSITGAIIELIFEIIFSPIGFFICKKWKKENVGEEYLQRIREET